MSRNTSVHTHTHTHTHTLMAIVGIFTINLDIIFYLTLSFSDHCHAVASMRIARVNVLLRSFCYCNRDLHIKFFNCYVHLILKLNSPI